MVAGENRTRPYDIIERSFIVSRGAWNTYPGITSGGCCCYLVDGGTELALIDAGFPFTVPEMLQHIKTLGFDAQRIKKVILTHSHGDHADGLAEVCAAIPGAVVYGHKLAAQTLIGDGGIYVPEFKPDGFRPFRIHETIAEGDTLRVGERSLRVMETPGHTPDGLSFFMPTKSGTVCFSGDTAIGDQDTAKGVIGWLDSHWGSRLNPFKRSLERLSAEKPDAILGGHGEPNLGRDVVATALKNCLWRLEQLMSIPGLETMTPLQF